MELKGINSECRNECVADALKRSGYRLREKKVSWPRLQGPAGLRIDVGSGKMVDYVKKGN